MAKAQNTPITKTSTEQLAWEGLGLGAATSLRVSLLYLTAGLLVMEFLGRGLGSLPPPVDYGFWYDAVLTILAVMFIYLFTIPPTTILGAMTGLYFGKLAKFVGERMRMSRYLFLMLSVSSCLLGVLLFHLLFRGPIASVFQSTNEMFSIGIYGTYPFMVGIPSLIYILMGSWIGWKLYSKVGIQRDGEA